RRGVSASTSIWCVCPLTKRVCLSVRRFMLLFSGMRECTHEWIVQYIISQGVGAGLDRHMQNRACRPPCAEGDGPDAGLRFVALLLVRTSIFSNGQLQCIRGNFVGKAVWVAGLKLRVVAGSGKIKIKLCCSGLPLSPQRCAVPELYFHAHLQYVQTSMYALN